MRHAIFSQNYRQDDRDVRCWWGISGEAMSFLVIDATSGGSTDAEFKLSTSENGSRGVLECAGGIHCIDITGAVVHLTEDCVGGTSLPMSAEDLATFLSGRKYPLTLAGVKAYLHDRSAFRSGTPAIQH